MAFKFCWPVTEAHTHTNTYIRNSFASIIILEAFPSPSPTIFTSFYFISFRCVCYRFIALTTATKATTTWHTLTFQGCAVSLLVF